MDRLQTHEYLQKLKDSENLADFVGAIEAYEAFRSLPADERDVVVPGVSYSPDQQFFVSRCSNWCGYEPLRPDDRYVDNKFRCNVPMMNMPEFASAFNCPLNSKMNPEQKCSFW